MAKPRENSNLAKFWSKLLYDLIVQPLTGPDSTFGGKSKCVRIWSQCCLLSEGTKTKQQQHQYFSILNNTTSYALPQQCQVNLGDLHPIHLIEKVAFLLQAIKIQNRIAVFYDTFYSFLQGKIKKMAPLHTR